MAYPPLVVNKKEFLDQTDYLVTTQLVYKSSGVELFGNGSLAGKILVTNKDGFKKILSFMRHLLNQSGKLRKFKNPKDVFFIFI